MNVFMAWKDSIEILRPKNSILCMFAAFNACVKGYALFLCRVVWLLIPMLVLFDFLCIHSGFISYISSWLTQIGCGGETVYDVYFKFSLYTLLFVSCLITRSSVERKTIRYFLSFNRRFLLIAPVVMLTIWMSHFLAQRVSSVVLLYMILPCFVIWLTLFTLYVLDVPCSMQSVWRASKGGAKMMIYNLPLFVVVTSVSVLVSMLIGLLFLRIGAYVEIGKFFSVIVSYSHMVPALYFILRYVTLFAVFALFFLIFLGPVSIISTLYIKRLHDNKDLYI